MAFVWLKNRVVYLPKPIKADRLTELLISGFEDYSDYGLGSSELYDLKEKYLEEGEEILSISLEGNEIWSLTHNAKKPVDGLIKCISTFLISY